jgi:hypothetical protein
MRKLISIQQVCDCGGGGVSVVGVVGGVGGVGGSGGGGCIPYTFCANAGHAFAIKRPYLSLNKASANRGVLRRCLIIVNKRLLCLSRSACEIFRA